MNTIKNKLTPELVAGMEVSNCWGELLPGCLACITFNRARSLATILVPLCVLKVTGVDPEEGESSLSNMRGEAIAVVATRMTENRLENVMSGDQNKK